MTEKQNKKNNPKNMTFSNPLQDLVGYQLRRASAAMLTHLGQGLSDIGLKITETSVLVMIEANPGMKQSDIGRVLGIKSANMAPLVAVLSDRGLIKKKPLDGRSHGLHLSEEGKQVIRRIWDNIGNNEAWLTRNLSEEEKNLVARTLENIWK
ncbi:MarR family winged helix-turn-helix transcriptional regulator [Emcibacter sp.]|uniref:MarR family winged helix-turn-helix transcriptional regulator n=1 Tax=Emcibacter sp. TaxID=1979954 RepID=UPI003A958027